MPLDVGDPVRVRMTKWPDRPHAAFTGAYLGADAHGYWVGARAGTPCERRGVSYRARNDWVTLLAPERWWRAGFYEPATPSATYVDIATPAVWSGAGVTCVDLDLDVVLQYDGTVLVDDQDEFDEHRVDYPAEVVAGAETARDEVHAALLAGEPPFDGSHEPWLALLRERVPV